MTQVQGICAACAPKARRVKNSAALRHPRAKRRGPLGESRGPPRHVYAEFQHGGSVHEPFIIIIAGPNGAGKSTFAEWFLPSISKTLEYVDPDEIARGLTITDPIPRAVAAGRMAISRIDTLITRRTSFALESTLSGRTLGRTLQRAADAGYYIVVVLLWIADSSILIERVSQRVRHGGHDIAADVVVRRFTRTYYNFFSIYKDIAHEWHIYGADEPEYRRRLSGGRKFVKG